MLAAGFFHSLLTIRGRQFVPHRHPPSFQSLHSITPASAPHCISKKHPRPTVCFLPMHFSMLSIGIFTSVATSLPQKFPQYFPATHKLLQFNQAIELIFHVLAVGANISAPFRSGNYVRTSLRTPMLHSACI